MPAAVLVWVDYTQLGTLQAEELDSTTEEDKLDVRSLASVKVSIRMESGHGNRKLPLLFTSWVAVNDSAQRNAFQNFRMLVTEQLF